MRTRQCPNGCAPPMEARRLDTVFRRHEEYVLITNLLMYVCEECGQERMPSVSARLVEAVLNGKIPASGEVRAELYDVAALQEEAPV